MPIYEYECAACGERFDKLIRSISQTLPEIECPACHSTEVQRLISAPTIRASGESGGDVTADSGHNSAAAPPIMGRKELRAAQEKKKQLREQAKYGD
ncbi:MAG: hypothetical protein JXM69_03040 [Anaerolineae bacterium]|nr:hypothetical protein [Anaerolineae bacterium]